MNKKYISFIKDEALETLYKNSEEVAEKLMTNRNNTDWLKDIYRGEWFEEKKYRINDFELKTDENYSNVDYENSIILYENLKELPRYILTDERFWMWILLTKGYRAALQAMKINSKKTFEQHWLFSESKRRSLFFNVLARCYLRVALSVDDSNNEDPYWLTKFVIEKPERFRTLSWRSSSSEKTIVIGTLKAEKDIIEKYKDIIDVERITYNEGKATIYSEISKQISLYGSVRLIDAASEQDIYNLVYNKMDEMVQKELKK